MSLPTAPKFGVKFPTRKERTVKRVTKCETREIQKRLEPPKPVRVRPPPKPKSPKKATPPATLCKPVRAPRVSATRPPSSSAARPSSSTAKSPKQPVIAGPRTLQISDLEKLARLTCSREFSLFNQFIKAELSTSSEKQLAFLQTKLQHLKNEFVNKQAEHLNFEQIREYYNQALKEHVRRNIKSDEYLTLANKLRQDIKQAIDKWLKKKEFKPQRQIPEYLQRRQERIRDRIKETVLEQKKQQQIIKDAEIDSQSESCITLTKTEKPAKIIEVDVDDDDIMIID